MSNNADNEKKPIYKRWWFWLIIVIIIIAIIGGSQGEIGTTNTSTTENNTVTTTEESAETDTQTTSENSEDVKVTLEQYNKIEDGMTYDEVVSIFGGKETSSSESEVAGIKSQIMTWNGNGNFSVVSIGFTDGKVSSKSQTGLE